MIFENNVIFFWLKKVVILKKYCEYCDFWKIHDFKKFAILKKSWF